MRFLTQGPSHNLHQADKGYWQPGSQGGQPLSLAEAALFCLAALMTSPKSGDHG